MSKTKSDKTPQRLLELLKQKQQKENEKGVMGKDLASKYSSSRPGAQKPTKRGGRNGQGKP